MNYPILIHGTIIQYNSPTAKYTLATGWDELAEATIIGQDEHEYFTREYKPGKFTGIHKSRFVKILKLPTGTQLTLFD